MRRAEPGKPVTFDFRADKPGRFRVQLQPDDRRQVPEMQGTLIVDAKAAQLSADEPSPVEAIGLRTAAAKRFGQRQPLGDRRVPMEEPPRRAVTAVPRPDVGRSAAGWPRRTRRPRRSAAARTVGAPLVRRDCACRTGVAASQTRPAHSAISGSAARIDRRPPSPRQAAIAADASCAAQSAADSTPASSASVRHRVAVHVVRQFVRDHHRDLVVRPVAQRRSEATKTRRVEPTPVTRAVAASGLDRPFDDVRDRHARRGARVRASRRHERSAG